MSQQIASFAAGCFWGVEANFRALDGVSDAVSGYMGGHTANPSYEQVCSGSTGHAETVQVTFDDAVIPYSALVDAFFEMHNPTTLNRQGPDRGTQYRSAVFWHNEEQQAAAEQAIRALNESGRWSDPVVTALEPAAEFWRAEEYHQRYFEKNGGGHCAIS